jgi:hypothetical protein
MLTGVVCYENLASGSQAKLVSVNLLTDGFHLLDEDEHLQGFAHLVCRLWALAALAKNIRLHAKD